MKTHRNIQLLSYFNFFLDLRFYSPVAIIYFSQVAGSFALGMTVFSTTMLSSALFEVPTGIYSDRIGRKKTLVLGALASLVSVTFYALAGSYLVLLIGAVFEGVARSFYSGNNEAFLMDTLAETENQQDYAEYLGKTSSMFQWALGIAAVIGGVVANISFSLVMWISVIPAIVCVLIACQMKEPKIHKEEALNIFSHIKEALVLFRNNAKLRQLSLANIIGYAQGEAGYQFRAAFIQTLWPIWAIGLSNMLSNIGAALGFHFSGRLVMKFKALPLLLFGKGYSFFVNSVSVLFPTIASPVMLSSSSLFFGPGSVAVSTLLQGEYSQKQRSTMGSLNALFGSIVYSAVAFMLGLMADHIGPAKAILLLQLLSAVSIYLNWDLFRKEKKGMS
ncbi:MAG: MFS transporter [Desulfobacteraceae bacterium]|nr:MFS transporter [Desulfobacteraceae bacterium]